MLMVTRNYEKKNITGSTLKKYTYNTKLRCTYLKDVVKIILERV